MKVEGVILAGGKGLRLRPLTYYFQKCMIPVGSSQKPLLEYVIRLMRYHGIKDILVLVGYKREQIINYFGDGSRFGVNIKYVIDRPGYEGTAGCLLNAYEQGLIGKKESLLVYYGDILSNINLRDLIKFHEEKKATATLAMALGYKIRVGTAKLDEDGRVLSFIEKPELERPVSIGVLVLEVVEELRGLKRKGEIDLMSDLIPKLIELGYPVYGYLTRDFWYDVGSTERYEKLSNQTVDKLLGFLID